LRLLDIRRSILPASGLWFGPFVQPVEDVFGGNQVRSDLAMELGAVPGVEFQEIDVMIWAHLPQWSVGEISEFPSVQCLLANS
jgi:hypothetical protein